MNINGGYTKIQKLIDYEFSDSALIIRALSHSSYANEMKLNKHDDYERLEFLGDAVLELTVSEFLYREHPEMMEGDMTKLRASLVCEPTLAYCAKQGLDLGKFILLGKGEDSSGGRNRDSIVSDVFEAIVGALYLDGGIEPARKFIERFVLTDYEKKIEFIDSKTLLQEIAQDQGASLEYELVEERGPAHDRDYVMRAVFDGKIIGNGIAKNKKAAQQAAAYEILKKLASHSENN
ncbi:MAG: ribonuclease III [Lachnospiraceae bacterium]|nr:ribonuclease III [Lachnospiraceae bacterium]